MIAVVIPAYHSKEQILAVLAAIDNSVGKIYVVDDACPEGTGNYVAQQTSDPRIRVLHNHNNLGVGGAVLRGYAEALADGAEIVVKIDSDGQMDPRLIHYFINPIQQGLADYTKGNRFYDIESLRGMPAIRLIGNSTLSLLSKFSSGYWNIMDPTNGYTAIHAKVLRILPLDRIDQRYFFESDMLFRLNTVRAYVIDIPMRARYAGESSNLVPRMLIWSFFKKHLTRIVKRTFYNYFLHDLNIASIQLIFGLGLLLSGGTFGLYHWSLSISLDQAATSGTVMLAALPILLGVNLLLSALSYDIANTPKHPIHRLIWDARIDD